MGMRQARDDRGKHGLALAHLGRKAEAINQAAALTPRTKDACVGAYLQEGLTEACEERTICG
jgi:hypothetical protein